ncbi:hypothetical protein DPMN_001380 [Dreissena polymorpha]|uniref:Uncharacterized protein n=1 Tax=Dreissena polymorpha TaxID=45954 RepID=A0A9D4MH63_DREPO|nr:hypothetical protein DPMN_001380 [Dreissena polymorpha]
MFIHYGQIGHNQQQHIIGTNLLTKFHEDQTINVASREKNSPPHWTINVASRELTRQMLMPHNAQQTTDKRPSQKLTMSTLCSDSFYIHLSFGNHLVDGRTDRQTDRHHFQDIAPDGRKDGRTKRRMDNVQNNIGWWGTTNGLEF